MSPLSWHGKFAQVTPTPQHINPGFSGSRRYLTTRFHHLRTLGQFVLDHVLQRADGYISRFSFRFAFSFFDAAFIPLLS